MCLYSRFVVWFVSQIGGVGCVQWGTVLQAVVTGAQGIIYATLSAPSHAKVNI